MPVETLDVVSNRRWRDVIRREIHLALGEVVTVVRRARVAGGDHRLTADHGAGPENAGARPPIRASLAGRRKALLSCACADRADGCAGAAAREVAERAANRLSPIRHEGCGLGA